MHDIKEVIGDIFRLIRLIQKRPWMYLSNNDIYSLNSFFSGLFMGYFLLAPDIQKKDWEKLEDLNTYIGKKLFYLEKQNPPDNPLRQYLTHELLLLASDNNPEKAFDLFFKLFDEYEKEKGIIHEWDEPIPTVPDQEKHTD